MHKSLHFFFPSCSTVVVVQYYFTYIHHSTPNHQEKCSYIEQRNKLLKRQKCSNRTIIWLRNSQGLVNVSHMCIENIAPCKIAVAKSTKPKLREKKLPHGQKSFKNGLAIFVPFLFQDGLLRACLTREETLGENRLMEMWPLSIPLGSGPILVA